MFPLVAALFLALPAPQDTLDPDALPDGVGVSEEEFDVDAVRRGFADELAFETGSVQLSSGEARFDLPDGWAFLETRDARRVVEELWGNPPDPTTIGFLDPPHELGRLQADFGIIVSMDESGYIEDDDAADYDFDELLEGMQESTREENAERLAAGYETIELVGWAEPPHYDAAAKKLYWAKKLRFGETDGTVLNYDVRILGRRGALVLQAVAMMDAFDEVQSGMQTALAATSFNEGHRYSDFDPSMDKVAAIGIGGLIAGKVAAKAGLFAVIAKFGKLIVVALIGAFVALKNVFFGRKEKNAYVHERDEPEPAE